MESTKRGSEYTLPNTAYQTLLHRVTVAGCFRPAYLQHTIIFLVAILGLSFIAYTVTLTDNIWISLLSASAAGFFMVQLGLIGHDLSHAGVFRSKKANRLGALLIWSLSCGLSESRWFAKHNAHHQSPNHIGYDPDIDIPFVFSHEQGAARSPFYQKFILPHQHILFWVGIWFVYPSNILNSMRYLLQHPTTRSIFEIGLMIVHYALVFGFTYWHLPPLTATLFNLIVFLVIGVYMALVFAPNHKGEDMLRADQTPNWVHQITLTRNITPSPVITYIFGGIECQIEHHLFPTMPRFHYREARIIVKDFCSEHHLPYHETSWLNSLRQIHSALRTEAAMWR